MISPYWLTLAILSVSVAFILFHAVNALLSVKYYRNRRTYRLARLQGVTVLVPCYNEADILESSIYGMERIRTQYGNVEYIFINDGSTDSTLDVLKDRLSLVRIARSTSTTLPHSEITAIYTSSTYSNVYVIDKYNGGKSDALNAGINAARHDLIVTLDGDTLLDDNALHVVNTEFHDRNIIAGGGVVHVLQSGQYASGKLNLRKRSLLVRLQVLDYLKGFMILKASLSRLNSLTVVSGAFGVFRKSVLNEVGGFRNTIGEDMDITIKIQLYTMKRKGKRIVYMPDALSYTECPSTWRELFNQRVRWQKAYVDCLFTYFWSLLWRFFKGGLPFFFLFEVATIGVLLSVYNLANVTSISLNEPYYVAMPVLGTYLVILALVSVFSNIVTLHIYGKFGGLIEKGNTLMLIRTIIGEVLVFRLAITVYIVCGIVFYFFNRTKWNKVSRTGVSYVKEAEKTA